MWSWNRKDFMRCLWVVTDHGSAAHCAGVGGGVMPPWRRSDTWWVVKCVYCERCLVICTCAFAPITHILFIMLVFSEIYFDWLIDWFTAICILPRLSLGGFLTGRLVNVCGIVLLELRLCPTLLQTFVSYPGNSEVTFCIVWIMWVCF